MWGFKYIMTSLVMIAMLFQMSSCATVFGGQISEHQKRKPAQGEPRRKIRPVPFIIEAVFIPAGIGALAMIIDFSTRAIYKPLKKTE